MAAPTPHVIVWLGTSGDQHTPTTFTSNGELLLGNGPSQYHGVSSKATIGQCRANFGDPSVAPWLPADCPCLVFAGNHNTYIQVAAHHVGANVVGSHYGPVPAP